MRRRSRKETYFYREGSGIRRVPLAGDTLVWSDSRRHTADSSIRTSTR